jgi:4'-phosphopantetheinyl transferase
MFSDTGMPALSPDVYRFLPGEPDIHVWFASLAIAPETIRLYETTLSADEVARAASYRMSVHRSRFIAARGMLRVLAAQYLRVDPRQVEFRYGRNGKPEIATLPIHFNLSHAGDVGVFAFTQTAPVGIDLEQVQVLPEMADIARLNFSRREADSILALPAQEQAKAFFHCWTRKEALVKAVGEGLAMALSSFSVSVDEPAVLLDYPAERNEKEAWSLFHFDLYESYVGAVAIRDRLSAIRLRPFRGAAGDGSGVAG